MLKKIVTADGTQYDMLRIIQGYNDSDFRQFVLNALYTAGTVTGIDENGDGISYAQHGEVENKQADQSETDQSETDQSETDTADESAETEQPAEQTEQKDKTGDGVAAPQQKNGEN